MTNYIPGVPEQAVPASQVVDGVGPFWTQTRFECEFMGNPYVGTGCLGYDPTKKKFVGTWIDSMSTDLVLMEGEMDAEKNALVMHWESPDPTTGKSVQHRSESVQTKDSYTSTFYTGEGEGTKSMVMQLKRVDGGTREAGTTR